MKSDAYYLTARQAADALGVTAPTLYAYTSRGQLRSEPIPGRPRERRYYRDDVERLRERKETRRDPSKAAARGLHWGGPVLESGITLIHEGRVYYRGRDAVALAADASLEDIAALLWSADETERKRLLEQSSALSARQLGALRTTVKDPLATIQAALPIAAASDFASLDLRAPAVRLTGARILRLMTNIVAPGRSANHLRQGSGGQEAVALREQVHRRLQAEWAPRHDAVANVIRAALVLCADHELNVSAFTARCAASAGASPYDVVSAAMATLKGYKHGGAGERVMELLSESDTLKSARTLIAERMRSGQRLPGFGHPLYPSGDPRATLLLRLAEAGGNDAEWRRVRALSKAGLELLDDLPNLDFGLAAVTRAYGLPAQAPVLLFLLGRTSGWIAHAMEEYSTGQLIRPRARYTGPPPV